MLAAAGITSISASLIVRDEERFLPACLASLRGAVDEVVIADTGSADRSREIAEAAGARVVCRAWDGDFAAARNYCLDACRSEWILYIDADECLRLPHGASLAGQIHGGRWAAAMVKFRPKTGFTRYWEHRLFRRDPAIRFEGKIHESHVATVRAFADERGLSIGKADVFIDHFGYDGDQSHKHPRNLPLLVECVTSNPQRIYYWYHLTETYAALGRVADALATGDQGLALAGDCISSKDAADLNLLAQAVARLRIEAGIDPSAVIECALRRIPDDHAMQFLKARWLVAQGRLQDAIDVLDHLLAIDPTLIPPGLLAFDENIFGGMALELKAAALAKMGEIAAAVALLGQRYRPTPVAAR